MTANDYQNIQRMIDASITDRVDDLTDDLEGAFENKLDSVEASLEGQFNDEVMGLESRINILENDLDGLRGEQ